MKAPAPTIKAHRDPLVGETPPAPHERFDDEMVMDLERDQFVAETSRPVARATSALWALRVFVVLVSLMVIYTFVHQLR